MKDKTKRVSSLRVLIQLLSFAIIFYLSIIAVWQGFLLAVIMVATFFFSRVFCGWICPFGLYMDLITLFRNLLRISHWSLPEKLNKSLHKLRYVIVLVILTLSLAPFLMGSASLLEIWNFAGLQGPFIPFTILLDPLQTLVMPWVPPFGTLLEIGGLRISFPYVGEIMAYMEAGAALPLSIAFIILTVAGSFKMRRFWCRFCPTGVSFDAVKRFKRLRGVPFLHLNKEEEKCTKCGICKRVCLCKSLMCMKRRAEAFTHRCVCCVCDV